MPNFLHVASGTLASGAAWSFTARSTGAITEGAAETAWGGAWHTFFTTTGVAALYSTHFEYTASSTSTATAQWKQSTITRTAHTDVGTAATVELPDQVTLLWQLVTGQALKSSHGRMNLPSPVAAALAVGTGGHLSSGNATTLGGALTTLRGSLTAAGLTLVILTRRATKSGLGALTTVPVNNGRLSEIMRIQRRRGDKIPTTYVAA